MKKRRKEIRNMNAQKKDKEKNNNTYSCQIGQMVILQRWKKALLVLDGSIGFLHEIHT